MSCKKYDISVSSIISSLTYILFVRQICMGYAMDWGMPNFFRVTTPFSYFWGDLYCPSVSVCQISSLYSLAVRVLEIFWVYRLYAKIYKGNLT